MNTMTHRLQLSVRHTAFVAALCLASAAAAGAQPLEPGMHLLQPGSMVAHAFEGFRDGEKPAITLVRPATWQTQDAAAATLGRDAVYNWEVFLLGLQVPFETVDAAELGRGVSKHTRLLIVPGADALGDRQRRTLLRFTEKGGGLIVSGRLGALDERGRAVTDGLFVDLLGAEPVTRLPEQPFGLLHEIDARHAVSAGIEPGFRLNISVQRPLTGARPVSGRSLGTIRSYSGRDDDKLAGATLILANERGKGRVFWTRFQPQDVSRERDHQVNYQRLMVNAMAWVSRTPGISIAAWPEGRRSALAVAALPSVGFEPLGYLGGWTDFRGLLSRTSTPATYFLTSREAVAFPNFVAELHAEGEIALAGPSDDVISGMPSDVQGQRLAAARNEIGASGGLGVYPPGGFYDGNTVRAILEEGLAYLLLPSASSLSPGVVRWWDDVDYRAMRASTQPSDLPFLTQRTLPAAPAAEDPMAAPVMAMPLDPGVVDFPTRFSEIDRAGGLFVIPFYPEMHRSGSGPFRRLEETLLTARNSGTWIATLADIAQWWSRRSHVSVQVTEQDRSGVTIELVNDLDEPVEGITLLVHGKDGLEAEDLDGLSVDVETTDTAGSHHVVIRSLPPGSRRVRFAW